MPSTAELSGREPKLDILVNNAGVSWGAPLEEFPEIGWDKVFNTNVKGPFFLIQRLLPLLEAAGTPDDPARVINIGSIDGIRPPVFETYSYGPSKAAIHTLTQQMAAKLAPRNIIANAIAPGPFPTWMLSTGVGTGGDVEGTDWDAVGRGNSARPRRHARGHRRVGDLPQFARRCVHGRSRHHLRRRDRRFLRFGGRRSRRVAHVRSTNHGRLSVMSLPPPVRDATADRRPHEVVRSDACARRPDARRTGGKLFRPGRPERQRQVDHPALGDRSGAPGRRHDPGVRARHRRRAAGRTLEDRRGARPVAAVRTTDGERVPHDRRGTAPTRPATRDRAPRPAVRHPAALRRRRPSDRRLQPRDAQEDGVGRRRAAPSAPAAARRTVRRRRSGVRQNDAIDARPVPGRWRHGRVLQPRDGPRRAAVRLSSP